MDKEKQRDAKIKTIGNYVHESVPVSDNEVRKPIALRSGFWLLTTERTIML